MGSISYATNVFAHDHRPDRIFNDPYKGGDKVDLI